MGKGKAVTIGFRYYFGIHSGLGRGEHDELVEIKVGGKKAWPLSSYTITGIGAFGVPLSTLLSPPGPVTGNATIHINAPDLFGGDKGEGGIVGTLDVMMGGPTQAVNPRLAAMLGGLVPAFRGVATVFYDGLVSSMNPYPKTWAFRHRRILKGWDGETWYPEKAVITLTDPETGGTIKAMNPAHILYELETNRDWGRGKPRSRLDDAAYRAVADQLYAEGFGMCVRWTRTDSIESFAGSVLNHVGGNLFTSRTTGLRKLTIVRDDYDVDALAHFTPDTGLLSIEEDDNSNAADSVNEMIVTWRNPIDNTERQARERNPAAIRAAGGRILSADANYIGLPLYDLAARVAKRDLRAKAYSKRWKLILDRRARDIEPGAPFKFSMPSRGLNNIVVRAGRIEDNGRITITAVLDVFGLPATSFSAPTTPGWVPPNSAPQAVITRRLVETTWRDLGLEIDGANLQLIDSTTGFLVALAIKPSSLSLSYDLQSRVGTADFETHVVGDFCPTAELAVAIDVGPAPTVINLANGMDLDEVVIGSAVLLGDEICRVDALDLTAMTAMIARGCVDTVPATHAIGTRLWFIDNFGGIDPTQYTAGTTVQAKLLTRTNSGILDPLFAATDSLTVAQRQARPYPPGKFRLNDLAYPTDLIGLIVVSWAHRDRLLQADQLVDTTLGNIGPETGVTYTMRTYLDDVLVNTQSGLAGNSANVSPGGDGTVRVVLEAVRDGLVSQQSHVHEFNYLVAPSNGRVTVAGDRRITTSGDSRISRG